MRPGVVEALADRRLPETGDDGELFLEHAEAFPGGWERQRIRRVLCREPAGAKPQLYPPTAHLINLRDRDRQHAR
jgi:hypothetical protein